MSEITWNDQVFVFDPEDIDINGNRFLIGNGYLGYRGTLEEYSKKQRVACVLAGVYDKLGAQLQSCPQATSLPVPWQQPGCATRLPWQEPNNAPNPFYTLITCDGEPLRVMCARVKEHEQRLDFRLALHRRSTKFRTSSGNTVTVKSERFVDAADVHLLAMRCTFSVSRPGKIVVDTGIDGDMWDLNGPHLEDIATDYSQNEIVLTATTHGLGLKIAVGEKIETDFEPIMSVVTRYKSVLHHMVVDVAPGREYTFTKYASVYTSLDEDMSRAAHMPTVDGWVSEACGGDPDLRAIAVNACIRARRIGYDALRERHEKVWLDRWEASDVQIDGDDDVQRALCYGIYRMLIVAPTRWAGMSMPASAPSAQIYKRATFDTSSLRPRS